MKILFTYYIPSGGVETLNRQRAGALTKREVECHFMYQWPNRSSNESMNAPLSTSNSRVYVTDHDDEIKAILDRERFDAVIVISNYLMLERIRRLGFAGPIVFESQGLGTIEQAMGTLLEALPFIHSCCNAVLYPRTDHMKRLFHALYPDIKRFSFHNCLDPKLFSHRSLPKLDRPVIGWVGRIERNKNWRAFLRMADAWMKQHPELTIWIFYDGTVYEEDEMADFKRDLQKYHFGSRLVQYTNEPLDKMADYYSQIGDSGGFVCSTSITEGFGYALIEAMSCRCPVLASDSDGPRSFIHHNRTGKMYPGDDERAGIQEGLAYLSRSNQRESIRKRGQKHVRQHFSPETYAEHFLKMLNEIRL